MPLGAVARTNGAKRIPLSLLSSRSRARSRRTAASALARWSTNRARRRRIVFALPAPARQDEHEIVYYLARPYWGRGHAKRVAAETVGFGFESCGLPRIIATVDEANAASRRIVESLGFREDARISRDYSPVGYSLGAPAYRARQRPE